MTRTMTATALPPLSTLEDHGEFARRHIGADEADQAHMLRAVGVASRAALIDAVVPASIRRAQPMDLPPPASEAEALAELRAIAARNRGDVSSFDTEIALRDRAPVAERQPVVAQASK